MSSTIHPQARTTPKIRQEIKDSGLSDREAAKVFNITRATAAKWLKRDDVQDRSHRAHTLHTTLSAGQEAIVLSLRQTLYLPLDDLLYITRQYINADVSRSGLARMLKREGMTRLEDVIPTAEGETNQAKKNLQGLRAGLCSHRYQVSPADARRDFPPLSVCGHQSRNALGFPAHLSRHDGHEQHRFSPPSQGRLPHQTQQNIDRQ